MTYKVKLKKKPILKEAVNSMDQTYHSCVDLLLASSLSKLNLECGDRRNINSDTYISKWACSLDDVNYPSNNVLASLTTDSLVIKKAADFNDNNVCTVHELYNSGANSIEELREDINMKDKDGLRKEEVENTNDSILVENSSIDKMNNTGIGIPKCRLMNTQTAETITNIFTTKITTNDVVKKQLCLSPICSINTDDNKQDVDQISAKSAVCKILHSKCIDIPIAIMKNLEKFPNIERLNDGKLGKSFIKKYIEESDKTFLRITHRSKARELPEVRVANFIKAMEKEILPLQTMLNEIIRKCVSLGVSLNKTSGKNLIYKTPNCNETIRYTTNKQSFKSNRVVYSIVFDS
ncbi:hypothetical protein K1T71_008922 [Dendrolimus kikuchii]|uniref:Uncharacterized protein n=1 Tax=Dendrolimus kikuchii TaxID=765133 RepID=A0ACC1CVR9_9NEOP|nr:hypothetical protein K1T71_008922 [Dendrolimus kikuchii]